MALFLLFTSLNDYIRSLSETYNVFIGKGKFPGDDTFVPCVTLNLHSDGSGDISNYLIHF